MNCADCRCSRAVIWAEEPILECHRNPPQIATLDDNPTSGWPSVEEADWCAEWQAEEPTDLANGTMEP